MLRHLDLFSGIGGFSLGLERTGGFETVAFCEIEPKAIKRLNNHWPAIPVFQDVCELTKYNLRREIDVVTGGFPCQDLSVSGRQDGLQGARSSLWGEMLRIIGEVRPQYAIIENVSNLLVGESGAWFYTLLNDLASIGYDAQWHIIPASAVGAGHHRQRVWIIAYPNKELWDGAEKFFNSLSIQISRFRTSKEVLALLADYKQIRHDGVYPDHRKLDGISEAVDSLELLGNTVQTEIPEIIGHAILEAHHD